jgi:HEAT repeat protein
MKLYFLSTIIAFFLACSAATAARASDDDLYAGVLRFGTDTDIEREFSALRQKRGGDVDMLVLEAFSESHSDRACGALVRYVGLARIPGADTVLERELGRRGRSEDYREAVVETLGRLGAKSSAPVLAALYDDDRTSKRLKKSIIDALGAIGEPVFNDRLVAIAGDRREDPETRAHAVLALGELKCDGAYETVKAILLDANDAKIARMYAATGVAKIGGTSALDVLGEVLGDRSHEVAEYAVRAVADIGTDRGGELLVRALRSDYDKVRFTAAGGLARMKYLPARDILSFKADHDENEAVRREARAALEAMGASKETR